MKKIGIVGGLAPESTAYYYRIFIHSCHGIKELEGGYPEVIIYSVNIAEIMKLFRKGDTDSEKKKLLETIDALRRAGADFAIIACNAMHQFYDEIVLKSPIPLLSIVEETCKEVVQSGLSRVGLFGALPTMKGSFYQKVFEKSGISLVVPGDEEQLYISSKVTSELARGIFTDETREGYLKIACRMVEEQSIQGLVLGCTEIPLLLDSSCEKIIGIPLFDTGRIHIQAALRHSLIAD